MYDHGPAGYVCPLCQIAKGEPTSLGDQEPDVLYRDEMVTIFIAGKWWRSNPGHVIVIPMQHIENIYDLPTVLGHAIADASKRVALALKAAYKCDGVSSCQHNEPAGNQDVWHYHLHIFPRYEGDRLYQRHEESYWAPEQERRAYAQKLRPYIDAEMRDKTS